MIFTKSQRKEAIEFIDSVFEQDKKVVINKHRDIRSLDQNRLYWLWLTCIQVETGNDKSDLHLFFVDKFLPYEVKEVFGISIASQTSTTKLNTSEFRQYLDFIQVFCNSELSIDLPNPEDLRFEQFKTFYENYL